MTALEASRGPGSGEELTLEFRAAHPVAHAAWLRSIRIGGVLPGALLGLRVCTGTHVAFVLEASQDGSGRTIAAGDLIAAIFGLGQAHCLRVTAGEFVQPVAVSDAGVRLRLTGVPQRAVPAVTVEGDSW